MADKNGEKKKETGKKQASSSSNTKAARPLPATTSSGNSASNLRPPPPKKPPPPLIKSGGASGDKLSGDNKNLRQKSFVKSEKTSNASSITLQASTTNKQQQKTSPKPNQRNKQQVDQQKSPNFQRQRSFVRKPTENELRVPNSNSEKGPNNSPRFKRTRTISCIETTGINRSKIGNRNRNSNSISEPTCLNPGAKEFVMKREVPGISPPQKTANLSDLDKAMICEALQPPHILMKTKSRILIEVSDILFKAVSNGKLTPSVGAEIASKILEADPSYTFVESLINCSQECYHLNVTLRQQDHFNGQSVFIIFLSELYQVLKRKQWILASGSNPSLVLLMLLSDFCQQILVKANSDSAQKPSANEIDLFIKIFTAIGREMVGSAKLTELICHLRDVFLWSQWLENDDMSRKKLLHLIELQSADWQLSSEAIAYYYPPNEKLSIAT